MAGGAYAKGKPRFIAPRDNPAYTPDYVELMEIQYALIVGSLPCRSCGAKRHKYCVTANGGGALLPHASRRADWREFISHQAEGGA